MPVGDFNKDGNPDLVVAIFLATVSVLLGTAATSLSERAGPCTTFK